jgi:hypothetical protein
VLWKSTCTAIGAVVAADWALLLLAALGRVVSPKVLPPGLPLNLWRVGAISNWVGVVLFLVWFYRAAKSTPAARLSIPPAWCVGWFFVPFGNLYMPYKAMSEIAAAVEPRDTKARGIVLVWWVFFVARNAGRALSRVTGVDPRTDLLVAVIDATLSTGAAVALFNVMRFIHHGQARWAR